VFTKDSKSSHVTDSSTSIYLLITVTVHAVLCTWLRGVDVRVRARENGKNLQYLVALSTKWPFFSVAVTAASLPPPHGSENECHKG
jgi:hypothetical protein